MTESGIEGLLGTWAVPECPFAINYSLRVLDDIRLMVVDAFFSLPRGGAEIGGILLGKRDAQQVTILDFAPLECEHAFGPSFTLSPKDLARFSILIEQARKNSPDLQPVGWYHSHTRSEIFLSEADVEIHKRYFGLPWQIALVVKPHTFQPMRAGFFFRAADGGIHTEASYQEVLLEPLPVRQIPERTAPRPVEGGTVRADAAPTGNVVASPFQVADGASAVNGRSHEALADAVPDAARAMASTAAAEAGESERAEAARAERVQPEGKSADIPIHFPDLGRKPAQWKWITAILGIAAGLAVGGVIYLTRDAWMPRSWRTNAATVQPTVVNSLGLVLTDRDGDLQISWDRRTRALQSATRGTLEFAGAGGIPNSVRLAPAQLQTGSFTIKREAEKVEVVLSLEGAAGEIGRESANFMGKLPEHVVRQTEATSQAALSQEKGALAVQVERLKGELKAEQAKTQQLMKYMDQKSDVVAEAERMRNQLNAVSARNKELEKALKPKDDQIAKLQGELNTEKQHTRVLGQSLDDANAQLKLQQKKRLGAQDTGK